MNIKKIVQLFAIALGLVLAVATSGFKEVKAPNSMHTFLYTAPLNSYDQTDVQDPDNWQYTSSTNRCDDQDVKACRIFVTDKNVVSSGSNFALKPGFQINASSGSVSFVTSTDDGSSSTYISNRGL